MTARIGHVAIGRNEGARLMACLASLARSGGPIIYVDSGSTDGSIEAARQHGAHVVALDMSIPFTAARGRNAGRRALAALAPDTDYVQFIDGDCELAEGWIATAQGFLDAHPNVAVVCGRRREKHPEASVYNRLCDQEWDTPIGDAEACGGDALMRRAAVEAVGGYCDSLIAGEEPELCVRLRERGWRIVRLDAEMTRHDAAMTRFGQWWRRTMRGGHAFAEVSELHRASPKRIWAREARRPLFWSALAPASVLAAVFVHPAVAGLLAAYPVQIARIAARSRQDDAWTSAAFTVLAKFPEAQGVLSYWWSRLAGRRAALIEYKR
jgi:GT2 family glycosyltransferase